MTYRIRASDRMAFKRCRRAWDLGSRNRQNFEPNAAQTPVSLERAVRDALAVYYFPGMWEWNRLVVRPLVHQAVERSVHGQVEEGRDESTAAEVLERGHALLDTYAAWAPTVDKFTPIRIDTDFEVDLPDPDKPGDGLLTPGGEPIRYTDRVDLLVIDDNDAYWAIQHRLVSGDWAGDEALQLHERSIAWCWAWPLFYIGMRLAGTIYNEIRVDAGQSGAVAAGEPAAQPTVRHRRMYARSLTVPQERVSTEGNENFRRTRIPRSERELATAGATLAIEAKAATSADVQVYPSPSREICADCAYTAPCLILNEGGDAAAELARSYRQREPEQVEEGRLGGVSWSMNRGAAPPDWARPRSRQ